MDGNSTLDYFERRRGAMIAAIRGIVDIESPSHDVGSSSEVVDWVEAAFRSTGAQISVERIRVEDGEHLVIKAFAGDEKHVLLLGHTDTVHPVGTNLQNPTRIEGDKFYGCGIFDMKSGIVLMIEALRYFAETGSKPARPITIVLSCDEEVGSHTGRAIVEREAKNAEFCLVLEPSKDGMVKTGRKGTAMYGVHTQGRPAHAGLEPELGVNAITELARHVVPIHDLAALELGTTVNICTIRGGTTTNVIPEHAELTVDIRFRSMVEAERIDAAIHSIRPCDERVALTISGGINRPPMERTAEVVAIFEKARGLAAGFGYELGETQVGGASDGNFVAALGVPVLDGVGVAGAGAHTLDEHIVVSDVTKRAALVTLLLSSG